MVEPHELVIFDEFTSVVDRTVAKIGSAALAKALRRRGKPNLIAVTCHHDVIEWLDPDWVYDVGAGTFDWRLLRRRQPIDIEIRRCSRDAWRLFADHHYLTQKLSKTAICFMATVEGRPAAFTAIIHFPHPHCGGWREHRTVCLPDFQGVGIGNAVSECIASAALTAGKGYRSVTSHPGMIAHRMRSPLWRCVRAPSMINAAVHSGLNAHNSSGKARTSSGRATAAFSYVGPAMDVEQARAFSSMDWGDVSDHRLFDLLAAHGALETRVAAAMLRLTPAQTTRALDRLRDAGRILRCRTTTGRTIWTTKA